VFMHGVGLVMPQSMAGAMANYPQMAGSASGLLGFIQMSVAGLIGIAVGHGYDGTPVAMALAIALMGLLSLLTYLLLLHRRPGPRVE
ncbi:MAG: multidrug effflux MFS transporter, partial [Gammaproteobacteria bacterium]|nr:multidrug effflux MFS transporter [Gammaproteobacteria bacterium]